MCWVGDQHVESGGEGGGAGGVEGWEGVALSGDGVRGECGVDTGGGEGGDSGEGG